MPSRHHVVASGFRSRKQTFILSQIALKFDDGISALHETSQFSAAAFEQSNLSISLIVCDNLPSMVTISLPAGQAPPHEASLPPDKVSGHSGRLHPAVMAPLRRLPLHRSGQVIRPARSPRLLQGGWPAVFAPLDQAEGPILAPCVCNRQHGSVLPHHRRHVVSV
eukprot:scaffold345054_cov29-Prasinocladus_malaysianus.AAC.1